MTGITVTGITVTVHFIPRPPAAFFRASQVADRVCGLPRIRRGMAVVNERAVGFKLVHCHRNPELELEFRGHYTRP